MFDTNNKQNRKRFIGQILKALLNNQMCQIYSQAQIHLFSIRITSETTYCAFFFYNLVFVLIDSKKQKRFSLNCSFFTPPLHIVDICKNVVFFKIFEFEFCLNKSVLGPPETKNVVSLVISVCGREQNYRLCL